MYGLDLLGLAKYSKVAIEAFPNGWGLGCFSSTFGDARSAVEKIIDTGRCPRVRVQLAWRDRHDYTPKDFPAIVKEARKWRALVQKTVGIQWHFSGACEHNLSKTDAKKLADMVTNELPGIWYVNNPQKQGNNDISGPAIITERHGADVKSMSKPYNFSFDGNSATDSDVTTIKTRLANSEIFFLWHPRFNMRKKIDDTTPIAQRTAAPTAGLIKAVAYLATDRGNVKLPKNWLMKSDAEMSNDDRSNKPVFIVPIKTSKLTLKAGDNVVGTCPYYGTYVDGRWRNYCTQFGYQISQKALDVSGSPVVEVWAEGKKWGTCNLAFRQGGFR